MTNKHPRVGSIGDSTRDDLQGLAFAFAWTLRKLAESDRDPSRRKAARLAIAEYEQADDDDALDAFIDAAGREALESYSAPYLNFHENSDGQFGYWPDIPMLEEDALSRSGVVKLNAGDPWPSLRPPHGVDIHYVMEVTDHGNVTLYNRRRQEIWSCV